MSLVIKNTKALLSPENFRLKILVYGLPGTGKTSFAASAPNPGFGACETGHGDGLLSIADKGLDYVELANYPDLKAFCQGQVFKDKATRVLDSLSDMARTHVKNYALSLPRRGEDSPKRKAGIPELDDYGVMGETTRQLLRDLIQQGSHVVVTATEKYQLPDPERGITEVTIGPDLPGSMFLASPAMFDVVLRLRTRSKLRDPRDAKSRYTERYFLTENDGRGTIAKCRSNYSNKPLLDSEEIFDPASGVGTFDYMLKKILAGYAREGRVEGAHA